VTRDLLEPDALLIRNERIKLLAGFLNTLAIGLIAYALVRPLIDATGVTRLAWLWGVMGLAMHGLAHYVLGQLRKERRNDEL